MISPFAAYFYSFYSPIIDYLYNSRYTNWMTEFFLPHFVFFKNPLMQIVGIIQMLTFFSGIFLFLYAAIPLYWAKFRRKGIVTRGIYYKLRHPQYLGLGIAGFGLLLYWPRFLILILYVSMLFVYYLLARNEEQRMINQYGESYQEYMKRVPMFLPKNIGGKIYTSLLGSIGSKTIGIIILYFSILCLSIGLAFTLRSFSINKVPFIQMDGFSIISVLPEQKADVIQMFDLLKRDDRLKNLLTDKRPNLAYIMPSDFFLMAIVTDMERLYPIEFERPRGGNTLIRFVKIFLNYTKMQLGIYEDSHGLRRIIFISVKDRDGKVLEGKSIFSPGSRRFPLFLIDFDMDKKEIISIQELKPRHKWGDTPMPIF
jgi:protein-S-isoprenylcysteine O-methyltransferase Ste14